MKNTFTHISKYIPVIETLRNYNKSLFRGDLNAGITVAIMLIPQGMAYAVLAGLPPVYGLYASVVPIVVYAIFGTSRQLGYGPVALISILVLAGVGQFAEPGTERFIQLAILTAFAAGALQLLMGILKAGFLVNFLSRPVLSGFISAAAVIIVVSQAGNLLGVSVPGGSTTPETIWYVLSNIGSIDWIVTGIGAGSIGLMILLKRWKKIFPGALAVVVAGTLLVYLFELDNRGVDIVGEIHSGLPGFTVISVAITDLKLLWAPILAITLVSFLESIAVAKSVAANRGYKIDPNQELIALGGAKLVGSLFQAYPTSGGFSRTAVNEQAGGSTTVSLIISAVMVAVTVMFLTPLFYYLPMTVLAAIIILAVTSLFDLEEVRFLWRTDHKDFAMLSITFMITLFIGIEEGILAGVLISLVMVIYSSTKPHHAELGRLGDSANYRNINRYPEAVIEKDILVYRFDSALYFANVEFFLDTLNERIEKKGEKLSLIVLDASSVNSIDSTGIHTLQELIKDLQFRRIEFYIAGAIGPVRDKLKSCGIIESIGKENFFFEVSDAIHYYRNQERIHKDSAYSPLQSNI